MSIKRLAPPRPAAAPENPPRRARAGEVLVVSKVIARWGGAARRVANLETLAAILGTRGVHERSFVRFGWSGSWFWPLLLMPYSLACESADTGENEAALNERTVIVQDCPELCAQVQLDPVATIGDSADAVLPRVMTQLAAGPGYIGAGLLAEEGVVGLYDRRGELIDVVGSHGAGPGEFQLPYVFPGPGGLLWIVDISNQRITELGPGGKEERSFRFSGAIHIAEPIDSSRLLLGGMLSGAYRPGEPGSGERAPPYYIADRELTVERTFGEWQREGTLLPLNITVGGDGHLYQAGGQVYRAVEWTATGEAVRAYVRRTDWFPPGRNEEPDVNSPGFWELRVDDDRRLWTIVMVPAGKYADAFDGSGLRGYSVLSFDRIRDSVMEVWDLEAGQVVARSRFPQAQMGFVRGSDQVYTVRQDSLGYVYFDLWEASIE